MARSEVFYWLLFIGFTIALTAVVASADWGTVLETTRDIIARW